MKRKLFTLLMLLVSVFVVVAISNTQDVEAATPTTIYLKPGVWSSDNAKFEAWVWGGGDKWVVFSDSDGDGIYETTVPTGTTHMKILRKSPSHATNSWNSWNDSGDQKIPTDGKNMFVVSDWNKYTWDTYTYVTPECYLAGSMNSWSTTADKFDEQSGVYTISKELTAGQYTFKIVQDGNWLGYQQVTNGSTNLLSDAGGNDHNIKFTATGGTYTFTYTLKTKTLVVTHVPFAKDAVKTLISGFYKGGVYTRTTMINIDKEAITEEIRGYFHNHTLADGTNNLYLERTTNFCDDYLYFEEGTKVGFGTSAAGTLTSFNWTGSYENSNHADNAIENYFVTLHDFATLTNTSNGVDGVSLANGWSESNGVYTSADQAVINAAIAFTAPGWVSPDGNYIDFTQVTIEVVDGSLTITLWCSSTEVEGKLNDDVKVVGTNAVFSQAIIG